MDKKLFSLPAFEVNHKYSRALLDQGRFSKDILSNLCACLASEAATAKKERRVDLSNPLLDYIFDVADEAVAKGYAATVLVTLDDRFDKYIYKDLPAARARLREAQPRYLAAWADKDPAAALVFYRQQQENDIWNASAFGRNLQGTTRVQASQQLSAYAADMANFDIAAAVDHATHAVHHRRNALAPIRDELTATAAQLIGRWADRDLPIASVELKALAKKSKPTDGSWPVIEQVALEIADRMAGETGEDAAAKYLLHFLNHINRRNREVPTIMVEAAMASLDRLVLVKPTLAAQTIVDALQAGITVSTPDRQRLEGAALNYIKHIAYVTYYNGGTAYKGVSPSERLSLSYKLESVISADSSIREQLIHDIKRVEPYTSTSRPLRRKSTPITHQLD